METLNIRGIHVVHYAPVDADRKAVVICAHGFLSSHQELGKYLPEELSRAGFHVYLYDHRGHGQSEGARGFVDMVGLLADFWEVQNAALAALKEKTAKVFGLGHSLGSVPVQLHARNMTGIVLVAPPARLDDSLTLWEKIAYPMLYYGITLPLNFLARMMGTDWELRIPYKFNRYSLFSEREYAERATLDLQEWAPARTYPLVRIVDNVVQAGKHATPTLVVAGTKDRVTGVAASEKIYNALATTDKTMRILDQSGHSIFQDHQGRIATGEIVQWLISHSS